MRPYRLLGARLVAMRRRFFIDDCHIERTWSQPSAYLDALRGYDCVLTPDFSLCMDMPDAMQQWNHYRSAALGRYWAENGLTVVPTLSWAQPSSCRFCFKGIPKRSTVATSTVGVARDRDAQKTWHDGMRGATKRGNTPLSAFAVASFNKGVAKGTTTEVAIGRFREQLMDAKVEYSAYIDDSGYVHALGSTGKEGETKVAPLSAIAKERGVSTIVHSHPFGTSDGRKWGGLLSSGDLSYIAAAYRLSGGKIDRIVAASNEGTYSARVTRGVSDSQVKGAVSRAEKSMTGKKFQSEIAIWRAVNAACTSEFGKIGFTITYTKQRKRTASSSRRRRAPTKAGGFP